MKQSQAIFVTLFISITMAACSDSSESYRSSNEVIQEETSKPTPSDGGSDATVGPETDEGNTLSDQGRPTGRIALALEMGTNGTSGQGTITLSGAFSKDEETLDRRVTFDSRNNNKDNLNVFTELREIDLAIRSHRDTYVNYGCDLKGRPETAGLTEDKSNFGDLIFDVAKVVFICDAKLFKTNFILISAETVIISNLKAKIPASSLIAIKSETLILENASTIEIQSKDEALKRANDLGLLLTAKTISGNGSLRLISD